METLLYVVAAIAALVLLSQILWRFASRRQSLPCPAALRWMVELDNPFTRTNRAAVILERLDVRPGMTVADLGCGPGRVTVPLARAVGRDGSVVALDLQEGMLDRARTKAAAEGLENIAFLQGALGEGRLEPGRFDRAVLVTVLYEIPDRAAALAEIREALRPDGILSVTEVIFDPHFQRRSTVLRLAEATGLREVARYGNAIAYTMHLQRADEA
ncbi:MAG: class I SAM-dependent methyltransferase [Planctomycetota bacterium]